MAARRLRLLITSLLALTLFSASSMAVALPPQPSGPVGDFAAVFPDASEKNLDLQLRQFFAANCIALVVATVPSLDGEDIALYANRLARTWDIGDANALQGILVLLAPNERKVRIELSRPINAIISNEEARAIIAETMIPFYRSNDFATGTTAGVNALIARLDGEGHEDGLDRKSCRNGKAPD